MMMSALFKVMWVGRATVFLVGLTMMLAVVLGAATTALAGTGVGATFNLGKTNRVNAISKLVGSVAGPSLRIDNNSSNASATALDLQVQPGKAPMKVNSATRVANLNADKVDGKNANELTRVAFEKLNDTPVESVNGTASRTTINAPTPGFLVIAASSNVFNVQHPDALVQCLIEVDGEIDNPSRRFMSLGHPAPENVNEEEDCSTNTVVPVGAGNHTINFEALDVGTGTNFDQTTLSAIFVPFNANGAPRSIS